MRIPRDTIEAVVELLLSLCSDLAVFLENNTEDFFIDEQVDALETIIMRHTATLETIMQEDDE